MAQFSGFAPRSGFTPIPNPFFSHLLGQIQDLDELKISLYLFFRIYHHQGPAPMMTLGELLADRVLMSDLSPQRLETALALAARRGTILHLELSPGSKDVPAASEDGRHAYLINNEAGRLTEQRLRQGDLALPAAPEDLPWKPLPDIFALYEENIGLLTPIVAQELELAAESYPPAWIRGAFAEAVALNKRSWRYISRILERWQREGRSDAAPGRDPAEADKYTRGKYGRFVRR